MTKVTLISCVSKKLSKQAKAKDLYISTLFRYSFQYAQSLNSSKIFILSAEHGLLDLNKRIKPYDKTLKTMPIGEIKKWAERVIKQLRKKADLKKDDFIFLAGENYRRYLIPYITNYRIPLQGLSFGRQLQFLKRKCK